ncbi:MAG TPA: packaged DNA stabilization protein [Acidimicrobiia bacterium]
MPVQVVGPASELRSLDVSAQQTVNLYPEVNPETTEQQALFPSSGFTTFTDLSGNGHGLFVQKEVLYAFVGENVYRIESGGESESIGTIAGMGRVRVASNGNQMLVIAGVPSAYVATNTDVTAVTDEDLETSIDVTFLNGRHVLVNANSGRFQWSDLLDAFAYDPLNFATAESEPDDAIAILSDARLLYIGGRRTIETWFDDGSGFSRTPQGVATKGVRARNTFIMHDNAPTFLGDDGPIYKLVDGYNVQRISTNAVDQAIQSYTDIENAFAFTYFEAGHDYYVITFPGQATWVYDANTQAWHTRKSYGVDDWDVVDVARAYNRNLGLTRNGDVVELSSSVYQEAGQQIERIRVLPPFSFEGKRFAVYRFELECETGANDSTTELTMEMALSQDRGRTFGNWKTALIGRQGDYKTRVFWTQLGSFRDVVVKLRQTSNAKAVWIRGFADIEVFRS